MYYFVYFMNTNLQFKVRINHLETFCLVLLLKKLVLFAENKRPANKLKSTNRHRDMSYKKLDLIDQIKYLRRLFIGSLNQYLYM